MTLTPLGTHCLGGESESPVAQTTELSQGWQLQDQAKVTDNGDAISRPSYPASQWLAATVPGTVLTSLVNDKIYPEPLYGENNRPDKIPELLCRSSYWYRTAFIVPQSYEGRKVWLHFDGINYQTDFWPIGTNLGSIKGAFTRGLFDITPLIKPGSAAVLAVLIHPQPHPGNPIEHTIENGVGRNGGITAIDGPTFLCSIGWDWIPGIRDRNTGIWQKVFLSSTGPVRIDEPCITSDLPLPRIDSADVRVQVTLRNESDQLQTGIFKGTIGDQSASTDYAAFQQPAQIPPHGSTTLILDPSTTPALRIRNPRLWWPNGYGPQNLYPVHLAFDTGAGISDSTTFKIGLRKITYIAQGSDNLSLSVNGVRVVCKGGDWGMDEALKRIPRQRLEAQIRFHQQANYTFIRNWVGQSTSADFYDLCDQYGIMLWDEFFQPNPSDGPNPTDLDTYLNNAREKIVRFRNHACIAIWCGRNEGRPPKNINDGLLKLTAELDPGRLYQASSTDGRGVRSGGPYRWREPTAYYAVDAPFKTEIGSVSVPTLEAVQAMMPQKDWETIDDDWVEHDLGKGASGGDAYPGQLSRRYGKTLNLADFVRKAQLANYEAFRAMYEGRFAHLFSPVSGIITWMSNPAQPSFVWQLYSWDLEPNASLFATRKACEPLHIMLNETDGHLQVINNRPDAFIGTASVVIYGLDGTIAWRQELKLHADGSAASDLGVVEPPDTLAHLHFVKLQLQDASGQPLSDNFYWRAGTGAQDGLPSLQNMPTVKLQASVKRHDAGEKSFFEVTLSNPSNNIALMAHLQLRRNSSGARVLPVYYSDNYISMVPQESKTLTIEAATADLHGELPLLVLDGWNVDVTPVASVDCDIAPNKNALVAGWPVTGIPIKWFNGPLSQLKMCCGTRGGTGELKDFSSDAGYDAGSSFSPRNTVIEPGETSSLPLGVFKSARMGECTYSFPMKPAAAGYTIRLAFAEIGFNPKVRPTTTTTIPPATAPTTEATTAPAPPQPDLTGKRIFNVQINGTPVLKNFDIFATAHGRNKPVVLEFKAIQPSKDGNITLYFQPGPAEQPLINGIEILPSR